MMAMITDKKFALWRRPLFTEYRQTSVLLFKQTFFVTRVKQVYSPCSTNVESKLRVKYLSTGASYSK